ncbi:DUF2851 family protein [Tenacibaculum amylolyticum]|uniref:DUF2851 family protein n=1 Tax=Tenacibaculum amylolyticum TaxID=104269 RepID=UPI0038940F5E
MKEKFIHYLWQYKLLDLENLITTTGENVIVFNSGTYNKNSGPDFLNASVQINNQLWYGNIEIHLKSSDWYAHHHEKDVNYDAVILHVVYENDVEIFMSNNKTLPTLELKGKIDKKLLQNYQKLFSKELRWISCEKQLKDVDAFIMNNWLERLFFERLEKKSKQIQELLTKANYDYEAVLFQLLVKNFGLKVNNEAFLKLAQSFNFSILRKVRFKEEVLHALLFGQGGFLEENIENEYYKKLQREYQFLQRKYDLQPLANHNFQFFRMRPHNFPTIRIAQLGALYHKHQNLFSKVLTTESSEDFYKLFEVKLPTFWKNHYTFAKESKSSHKRLTRSFIELIIINTIIPLKFLYFKNRGVFRDELFLNLMKEIVPEKNSVISKFIDKGITVDNAYHTQALLQLKNTYCNDKRCLDCAIGAHLIKN